MKTIFEVVQLKKKIWSNYTYNKLFNARFKFELINPLSQVRKIYRISNTKDNFHLFII